MPKLLNLVPKTDTILRETMQEVQNYTDPKLAETIKDMCYSILPEQLTAAGVSYPNAAGMAANQWGIKKRVFIFTPEGSAADKKSEVIINPSYVPYLRSGETEYKMVAIYEGCFSIPLTVGLINRYDAIIATYNIPSGERVARLMEGIEARVFQHETDHLDGKLYDGILDQFKGPEILDRIIFQTEEEMEAWFENKKAKQQNQHKEDHD